ncbi:MAG: hypothetical protein H6581_01715 [Bacteroidia bacterium]|nr:hypothetical protein [Bacteroidia bacterium]
MIHKLFRFRIFLATGIFLFVFAGLQAQSSVNGTVYLKNGSVLTGKIVEMVQDSILKIQILENSTLVFKWSEIDKVVIGNSNPSTNSSSNNSPDRKAQVTLKPRTTPKKFKTTGVYNITEAGLLMAQSNFFSSSISLTLSNITGWYFNPYIQAGVGVGLDRYVNEGSMVPVFADVRGEIGKNQAAVPYWYAGGGYGLGFLNKGLGFLKYDGGPMAQGGLGLKFYSRQKSSFLVSMGYRMQMTHKVYEEWIWDWWGGSFGPTGNIVDVRQTYHRITLSMGLGF